MRLHRSASCWALTLVLSGVVGAPCAARAEDEPPAPAPVPAPLPEDPLERAKVLDGQATALMGAGCYADALVLARQALALREEALPPDHPDVALSLCSVGYLLEQGGAHQEALPLVERALAIREKALGSNHPDVARTLHLLASLAVDAARFGEARALQERSLAILEESLGPEHLEVGANRNNLALILKGLGAYADARIQLERALAIVEKSYGPMHPDIAVTLQNLASVCLELGDYASAKQHLVRALAIDEQILGSEHPDIAFDLEQLGKVLSAMGDFPGARRAHERALAVREKALGPNHRSVGTSLHGLANLLSEQGHRVEARPLLERALAILERALGAEHPHVAATLNSLGLLLSSLGSSREARPLLERAAAIIERVHGPDHSRFAAVLGNLAQVLVELGELTAAEEQMRRALQITEKALGARHPALAARLGSLAWLLSLRGDAAAALPLIEQAIAIQTEALGEDHPDLSGSLAGLGRLLQASRDLPRARAAFERALALRERTLGPDHPDVAISLMHLGVLLQDLQRPAEALPLLRRALSITEADVRRHLGTLSSQQRLALVRKSRARLDDWLTLAAALGLTGHAEQLRFRGLVARAEAAERRLTRQEDAGTAELRGQLDAATRLAGRLSIEVPKTRNAPALAAWQRRLAETKAERERLALQIAGRSAPLRAALERLDLTAADVQAHLGVDRVLIEMLRVRDRYLAWVVRGSGEPLRLDLGDAQAIDEACAAFVGAIVVDSGDEGSAAAVRSTGAALKARVWSAIEASLPPSVRRVVICPDAALASIPFAALPGSEGGRWLLDEVEIAYVFHPFDLVRGKDVPVAGSGALVLGGVDYDRAVAKAGEGAADELAPALAASDRAPRGRMFEPLPATRVEGEGLRDRLGRDATTLLLGTDASEARLRAAVRGKRLVHIATHGFVREDLFAGLGSRRIEQAFLSADAERQLAAGHDPMLLSGLALAGANPRDGGAGDDGILTALEASYLDLEGVELVTLSACETAKGTAASGEGVLGLVSAFRMAGARRVLASLWKVDDEATQLLMQSAYDRLLADEQPRTPVAALREAALALRARRDAAGKARFAAPRYWAAFVAYGD